MRNDLDINFTLIRHSVTDCNIYPRSDQIGQPANQPLNEAGKKQAQQLHERFKREEVKFDYIYSSPYKRTIETTELVFPGQKYVEVPAIREIYQGNGIGKSRKELYDDKDFAEYASWLGMSYRWDLGESVFDVQFRAKKWLEETILNNPETPNKLINIAIVSHAMTLKGIIQYILEFNHRMCWKVGCGNCSLTKLHFKNGEWFVDCINDTSHLKE